MTGWSDEADVDKDQAGGGKEKTGGVGKERRGGGRSSEGMAKSGWHKLKGQKKLEREEKKGFSLRRGSEGCAGVGLNKMYRGHRK